MSRINTNVSSLNAQKTLGRSNAQLQEAMTRLSTGLRINSGKDDPAGLIASEMLRSDIVSTQKAITNSQRAGQMIATADSALSQVSKLLIEVRGLVTDAANEGALSPEQIAANQLQVDAALESLNRIAQITNFQGRKLLDGSLDFVTTGGANFEKASNLGIQKANLTAGPMAVNVTVSEAASRARVDITGITAGTAATNAREDFALTNAVVQADSGQMDLAAPGEWLRIVAAPDKEYSGHAGNDVTIKFVVDVANGGTSARMDGDVLEITVNADDSSTLGEIATAVHNIDIDGSDNHFVVTNSGGGHFFTAADAPVLNNTDLVGGRDAGSAMIEVRSDIAGAAGNLINVEFVGGGAANSVSVTRTGDNIVVTLGGIVSYSDIADEISLLEGISARVHTKTGDQNYWDTDSGALPAAANLDQGVDATGGISHDVVFTLAGKDGTETFNFRAAWNTGAEQMRDAINLLSDSTGVFAQINPTAPTTLQLISTAYGSEAFVDIKIIDENPSGTFTTALSGQGKREVGTDIEGRINGTEATGRANSLSLDTTTLAMSLDVQANYTGNIGLTINGGGAMFQIGPQVVGNQQARIGIGSVSTATLGGASGRMYELASGQSAALANDPTKAAQIIGEVIAKVASLQGRLGAFQKTTLDSNVASLSDTLENLTAAESSIRDADFAVEAAAMTRAQILVQSGTTVLSIANQNPQNVLALLR